MAFLLCFEGVIGKFIIKESGDEDDNEEFVVPCCDISGIAGVPGGHGGAGRSCR